MKCKWNHSDCKNEGESCQTCLITDGFYQPKSVRKPLAKRNVNHADGRMGSKFEYANHERNKNLVSSDMTLNSGATKLEKGDEQIRGIINVMEELKTQEPDRAKGTKTFSIQRKWLDKLNAEATAEGKEFWYLKFAFAEDEGVHAGGNVFCVTEADTIMGMVATMIRDRKASIESKAMLDMYKACFRKEQAKNIALESEIAAIKAQQAYVEAKIKIDKLFA